MWWHSTSTSPNGGATDQHFAKGKRLGGTYFSENTEKMLMLGRGREPEVKKKNEKMRKESYRLMSLEFVCSGTVVVGVLDAGGG